MAEALRAAARRGTGPDARALVALAAGAAVCLAHALTASGQDWSGASLRGTRPLALPPGYEAEVLAAGFRLPQDLALEPPGALWLLTEPEPSAGGAGALVRLPLGAGPLNAARLTVFPVPSSPDPARFRMGSLARHPGTGELFVAERLGRHLVRVTPGGVAVLYARGGNRFADSRTLAFDAEGRLLVLDFAGRPAVAEASAPDPAEVPEAGYEGPVIYRLRVDEPVPLPRHLQYAVPLFPPAALRRQGARLPLYTGLLALPGGDLVLSRPNGVIERLRPGDRLEPLARVTGARVAAAGPDGTLYAVDFLGGRIVRLRVDGAVESFAEGLTRPAAIALAEDGTVFVAEDPGRVLRLRPRPP